MKKRKKKVKLHFLNIRPDGGIPNKCLLCGSGVVVCCDKLFQDLVTPCMRKCCSLKAK